MSRRRWLFLLAAIAIAVLPFVFQDSYWRTNLVVCAINVMLAIGLVAVAGKQFGYALTLAGVAGLVISIGVTADSYIVFFERLKDELRGGKSPRSVVQQASASVPSGVSRASVTTPRPCTCFRNTGRACSASAKRRRFSATAAGSSPTWSPRLRVS